MADASSTTVGQGRGIRRSLRKWIAGGAAATLVGGLLVVAGIGAQTAVAAPAAPDVQVTEPESYIAGEDLTLGITFTGSAGSQYNLSAGVVLSDQVTLVDSGTLGVPKVYTSTDPETVLTGVIVPGDNPHTCEDLGLETPAPGAPAGSCAVAPGTQYLVFQNISDLPENASTSHSLTLRPNAGVFEVGSDFPYQVNAYTSSAPRFLPVFPGSTGVNTEDARNATSNVGTDAGAFQVNALRIEKSEPSPEDELLRGVHSNTTTYTLRIWHTGEGDLDDVVVTDMIPAGLEYLGLGGADHTTNANGNRGGGPASTEYDGADRLDLTPAPADSSWGGAADHPLTRNAATSATFGETVETVTEGGAVYTKVSWNIGALAAAGLVDYSILDPKAQVDYPVDSGVGVAGFFEIRYRAAIPLFENTMDFGGTTPSAESGDQGSNLDNNRGSSTRHGIDGEPYAAKVYTNTATAEGVYAGVTVSDTGEESVHAVDVRVLKSVEVGPDGFVQGDTARYTVNIATSEYVSAELVPGGAAPRDRFVDDLGDGLCPVFPEGTVVTGGGIPNLMIGNPGPGGDVISDGMDIAAWNQEILDTYGVDAACEFTSDRADSTDDTLTGATLTGIAFDPSSGHFIVEFAIDPLPANDSAGRDVQYSVAQNDVYLGSGEHGATTSADVFSNDVEVQLTTTAIPAVSGLTNADGVSAGTVEQAWDDSEASFQARLVELDKHVLKRSAGVPERHLIETVPDANWVKTPEENESFSVGDDVWFRIQITTPKGADVRNAVFTDFLPAGVEFDDETTTGTGRLESTWIVLPPADELNWIGSCQPTTSDPAEMTAEWLETFVPNPAVNGSALTFTLGSADCLDSDDRFLPLATPIEIFIKVTVTDADAFGQVDLAQNLAKYQQENVDGEVFFLRSEAEFAVATSPKLIKGVRDIDGEPSGPLNPDGNPFNSDVDNQQVVQESEVAFRVDVTAPVRAVNPVTGAIASNTETSGYVVWDALPEGIEKADIEGIQGNGTFTSAAVTLAERYWVPENPPTPAGWIYENEDPVDAGDFTAIVCDFGDPCYPDASAVRADIWTAQRSLIIWQVDAAVPASNDETALVDDAGEPTGVVIPRTERGLSLQYTVIVPDGSTGTAEALVTQRYENTASIVSYQPSTNSGSASTIVTTGDDTLSTTGPDEDDPAQFGVSDRGTFDDSGIYLPDAAFSKRLVSTEIGATTPNAGGTVGLTQLDTTRNNQAQIVQGEYAVFEYALTIPAHTSLSGAVLSDGGSLARASGSPLNLRYEFAKAEFFGPSNSGATPDTCGDGELVGFTCAPTVGSGSTATYGVLTFPAAEPYQNSTDDPQTFRVRVTVWMKDRDNNPANSAVVQIANSTGLTNTATAGYDNPNFDPGQPEHPVQNPRKLTRTASATTTFVEPSPALAKVVTEPTSGEIDINGEATYRLTASNANGRPALYDSVVIDCVPAEMEVVTGSVIASAGTTYEMPAGSAGQCSITGSTITIGSGTGQLIVWNVGKINGTGTTGAPTLTYKAKANSDIGAGAAMRNVARLDGYTLPNPLNIPVAGEPDPEVRDTSARRGFYTRNAEATVTMVNAALEKSVATPNELGSAPVGETVRYTLDIDLPPHANFYDVRLTDTLPAGLEYAGDYLVQFTGWPPSPGDPSLPEPAVTGTVAAGQTLTWTITPDDFALHTGLRTITVSFDAKVTDGALVASPVNTATFSWNKVNTQESTRTPSTDTAALQILNPLVALDKKVDGVDTTTSSPRTYNPDGTFTYTIDVRNSGTAAVNLTPAHRTSLQDVVPAGVMVESGSIVPAPATVDPGVYAGTGGTITWTNLETLYPSAQADPPAQPNTTRLTYDAKFVSAATLTGVVKENTARVTEYSSFDSDGRRYVPGTGGVPEAIDRAHVQPIFPSVVLQKTVASDNPATPATNVAYANTPFGWNLRATNDGAGAVLDLSVSDRLPENWVYDTEATRAPQIRLNGGAWQSLAAPTIGVDTRELSWSEAQIRAALGLSASPSTPVLAGKVGSNPSSYIEIRFSTIPTSTALSVAGVTTDAGVAVPHTNTLTAVAKDTRGDTGTGGGNYSPDTRTADAFIHAADLNLVKGAVGGTLNGVHGLPNGSWVPGMGIGTDYAQPQWRVTVNNYGPNASYGPFAFTDAPDLPTGVTVDPVNLWSARYYSSASDTVGTALAITDVGGSGTEADPYTFTVGDGSTSLAAGAPVGGQKTAGPDRIVITANVSIAIGATGTAENTASVDGRTFEDPANKPIDADHPNTDDAEKPLSPVADLTIAKVVNTTSPTVGGVLTWGITVTNLGPSVSQSTEASPITITDTVPVGMTGVTASSPAGWVATLADGTPIPAEGVGAGTAIKWTYVGVPSGLPTVMPVGATAQVTLSGTVTSSFTGAMTNIATVTPGPTPEPNPNEPNIDEETVTPNDETSLAVLKTRVVFENGAWRNATAEDPFVAGEQIDYRIDVRNTGIADARNVRVVDEVPAGLSYGGAVATVDAATGAVLSPNVWARAASGTNAAGVTNAAWDTFSRTGTLVAGQTSSFVVTYNTLPSITGDVVNVAEAQAENVPPGSWPRDPESTGGTDRHVDLQIAKTHTAPAALDPAIAGGTVDYRLEIANNGPSVATPPIEVEDTLPSGLTYRAGTSVVYLNGVPVPGVSAGVSLDGRTITWENVTSGADFALTDTVVITFTADVSPSMRTQNGVRNEAEVSGNPADTETNLENNHDDDLVNLETVTDMEITKVVEQGPWIAGTPVEYTLTVRNDGPSEASSARVVDTLPAGLTMVSMSGTGWDCSTVVPGASSGACDYTANSALHPVGTSTITVVANIAPSATDLTQPLNNVAVLSWSDTEGPHSDNDDEDIVVTRSADLGIAKSAVDGEGETITTAIAGESLWYSLVVRNEGPSDAIGPIVVNDTLPMGIVFVGLSAGSASSWTAQVDDDDPQLVTFTRTAGILNGASAPEILFETTVDPTIVAGTTLVNLAEIDADQTLDPNGDPTEDPEEAPDSDTAPVTIERQIDLGIEKTHDAAQVRIGDALLFTIQVTNYGPSQATGIVVTDTVPAGLEVVSVPGPVLDGEGIETGWTIDSITLVDEENPAGGATVVASYADPLAPGAAAEPLVLDTLITAAAYETVTNVVAVSGNEPEPDPDTEHPNLDEDPVTVPPMVTLVVQKTAVGGFQVGKSGTYRISVRNDGPTADPGPITVTDELPNGLTYRASPDLPTGTLVSVSGKTVTWTIQDGLAVGESVLLTLVVNVQQAAYPEVTNTVTIATPSELTPESVIEDDAVIKVKPLDPLSVTGGSAVGYLAMLAALLMLAGAVAAAARGRREARALPPAR